MKKTLLNGAVAISCAAANASEWELVWADEFDRDGLPDKSKWTYEEGFLRNNELQYYTRARLENARVEKGVLIIEAREEKLRNARHVPGSQKWNEKPEFSTISAASITTDNLVQFHYGRIEVRAKLPKGKGVWPAIWLLGANRSKIGWPRCGEIDIMEFVGKEPDKVHATVHYKPAGAEKHKSNGNSLTTEKPFDDFHIYALEWDKERLDFFYDDTKYHSLPLADFDDAEGGNPFRLPHYLLINLAIGGNWGGELGEGVLPARYEIDYVRYFKHKTN